mmetsp:Transcript_11730/g.19735  ORF Transcript_11730/g.19735 Transcript_11730/m.19735 type:complete len:207 (-) Transcript_11730:22-642(-)
MSMQSLVSSPASLIISLSFFTDKLLMPELLLPPPPPQVAVATAALLQVLACVEGAGASSCSSSSSGRLTWFAVGFCWFENSPIASSAQRMKHFPLPLHFQYNRPFPYDFVSRDCSVQLHLSHEGPQPWQPGFGQPHTKTLAGTRGLLAAKVRAADGAAATGGRAAKVRAAAGAAATGGRAGAESPAPDGPVATAAIVRSGGVDAAD